MTKLTLALLLVFPANHACALNENFSRFAAGSQLKPSSGFEEVTPSSQPWAVVEDPNLKARSITHGSSQGWSNLRYKISSKGYADLEADVDVSKGQANLFIDSSRYNINTLPADGYYYQSSSGSLYRDFGGRKPVLIGISTVKPADLAHTHVELRNNGGVIDVLVDGQQGLRVIDFLYGSGYWGFSGLGGPGYVANVRYNAKARPPLPRFPTPLPTPTPAMHPELCGSPWPRVWKPRARPILKGDADFAKGCAIEPSVIKIGSTFHMSYSANAFSQAGLPPTIGLATSDDGLSWEPYGKTPILGNKFGGEDGMAIRSSQLKIGSDYYIYYKNSLGDICRAVSSDGYSYSRLTTTVIAFNCLNQYKIVGFDSTGFYYDSDKDVWDCLVDANYGVTSGEQFRLWLFQSHDNAATFQPVCELSSIPKAKTDYGSPRAFVKIGKLWHLWYLYDVPSRIYEAVSPDLYNWTSYADLTLDYSPHMLGLQTCNQAADTCLLDLGDKLYLYYDGTDNLSKPATGFGCVAGYPAGPGGAIGVAIYDGSLEQYGGCGVAPVWTPTPPVLQ